MKKEANKYINDCGCGSVVRWQHPTKKTKLICATCGKTISNKWVTK